MEGLKMKMQSLTLWMVCFLLQTALSMAFVCTGVDDSLNLKLCQSVSLRRVIVYLYSSGEVGACACTLSSTGPLDSVEITSLPRSRPGMFNLVVDGNTVQTPVRVPYKSQFDLVLRKYSPEKIDQCLYVTVGDGNSSSATLHVTCKTIRDLTSKPPINTEIATSTEPNQNQVSTYTPLESPVVTEPENNQSITEIATSTETNQNQVSTYTPLESPVVTEPENNQSITGSITGAVIGAVAVIFFVAAAVIVLRRYIGRKYRCQEQHTGNTDPVPDYYNVPGGLIDQLQGTASNIPREYVNAGVEIETAVSNAANMNMYEFLTPQDQTETDHTYDSIASADTGIYINTTISGAS